jgi:pyridoxal/pyridoxine/pyridoxamine kinase
VVTSAAETDDSIATVAVDGAAVAECILPRRADIPNGAGDLLAGLLLGRLLNGQDLPAALYASLADLDRVLAASSGRDELDLAALGRNERQR